MHTVVSRNRILGARRKVLEILVLDMMTKSVGGTACSKMRIPDVRSCNAQDVDANNGTKNLTI